MISITEAIAAAKEKILGTSQPEVSEEKKTKSSTEDKVKDTDNSEEEFNEDTEDEVEETETEDDSEDSDDSEEDEKDKKKTKKSPQEKERTKAAEALYEALNNPNTAARTITALIQRAEELGIQLGTNRKETKEAAKSITEELKGVLPEEEHFYLDALGPAFEYIINKVKKEAKVEIDTLKNKLTTAEKEAERKEYESKLNTILSKDKYRPYLTEMAKLMDKIQPTQATDTGEYINEIYTLAKAKVGKVTSIKKQTDKIKKNLEDADLKSSTGSDDKYIVMDRPPTMSESIEAAKHGKIIKVKAS